MLRLFHQVAMMIISFAMIMTITTNALIVPARVTSRFTRTPYLLNSNVGSSSIYRRRSNLSPLRLDSQNEDSSEVSSSASTSSGTSTSSPSSSSSSSSSASTSSLWVRLDEMGQGCKKQGNLFRLKAQTQDLTTAKRIQYVAQACGFYTLFIMYRAYRGCFVILPAVFREVSRKLERAVELEDDDDNNNNNSNSNNDGTVSLDVNPETGKLRWRTRITVSILASIVTLSYVLGGALRVLQSFGQTLTKTASVSTGFEAAADQVVRNENQIMQRITKKAGAASTTISTTNNNNKSGKDEGNYDSLNGQFPDSGRSSGLAP